ncbi:MAG TPA: zf-HC2 domain-containing protein [Nitrospirota bacterium]|nr:zf-HC2 domain-containing protein [Nitrospirota bacterium]
MSCKDTNIKDFLPAYGEQALGQEELLRIEQHLDSCADCRRELALLRALSEDDVPDPGEAFWAAIPGRVFRAVQEEKRGMRSFDPARLWSLLTTYRLAAAAATIGIVLIFAWFTVRQEGKEQVAAHSERYEFSDEMMAADNPLERGGLDPSEWETAAAWANAQLASLSDELARSSVDGIFDADINEELSDLNAREIDHLANKIKQWKEEG